MSWDKNSPLAQTETINICLFKKDPFDQHLAPIRKKSVNHRPIRLRTIYRASQADLCHLIFINDSNDLIAEEDVEPSFKHSNSILLGNDINFVKSGGLLSFYIENNKVKLGANRTAIANSELKISSLLIEVCQLYGETP